MHILKTPFTGRIVFVGFGSIGQGLAPALKDKLNICHTQISVYSKDDIGSEIAQVLGFDFKLQAITQDNYESVLGAVLNSGDILLNLAVEVSTYDLICLCQKIGAHYLDTSIEPWAGGYDTKKRDVVETTNYWLREQVLELAGNGKPTAVIAHGANPGLISHLLKEALLEFAEIKELDVSGFTWAHICEALGIYVIQVAERDTQFDDSPLEAGEFANTWSIPGFLSEVSQPAEFGFGTHEVALPLGAQLHNFGCKASAYWPHLDAVPKVHTWTPSGGACEAYLITHNESISIAKHLSLWLREYDRVVYRPTVYYAYVPCSKARESLISWEASGRAPPTKHSLLSFRSIRSGYDELGVLLCADTGSFWYGSTLHTEEVPRLLPFNSATSLQVVAGILGAIVWMLENPNEGVVEAEQMDHVRVMEVARPLLGSVQGTQTSWRPSRSGNLLFEDFLKGF